MHPALRMAEKEKSNVKVVCRVRPPHGSELAWDIIAHVDSTGKSVTIDVRFVACRACLAIISLLV